MPTQTIEIHGVVCDLEKVAEAPGRCVRALELIAEFKPIMGDICEVVDFVRNLEAVLTGGRIEAWQSDAAVVVLEALDA